jgi:hypothetical protein
MGVIHDGDPDSMARQLLNSVSISNTILNFMTKSALEDNTIQNWLVGR